MLGNQNTRYIFVSKLICILILTRIKAFSTLKSINHNDILYLDLLTTHMFKINEHMKKLLNLNYDAVIYFLISVYKCNVDKFLSCHYHKIFVYI